MADSGWPAGLRAKLKRSLVISSLTVFALTAVANAAHGQAAIGTKPGWPNVGDRWVYEARDADRPQNKHRIVVQVQEVTPSSIDDVVRIEDRPQVMQTHRPGAYLRAVAPGIADFSPYLRAFQELRGGESWSEVEFKKLWECGIGLIFCHASARVAGKEKISVPAGTYEAWKIVVKLILDMGGSATGYGELSYWLAEETRRIVKYQSRVKFQVGGHYTWPQPDIDMELQSYVPAAIR